MTDIELFHGRRLPLRARIARLRAGWQQAARRRAAYRQTHSELTVLTDRELADLDIARSDIARIAREAADAVR